MGGQAFALVALPFLGLVVSLVGLVSAAVAVVARA